MSNHQATYRLRLDVNRDETYSLELPVTELEWNNGMSGSFDTVADVTQLQATVSNAEWDLTRGIFGDFAPSDLETNYSEDKLLNGGFDDWTASEPDDWRKRTYAAGMTTSETASGGGVGTGSLHVTGTGEISYMQLIQTQRLYEVKIVVSEFSGDGEVKVQMRDRPTAGVLQHISGLSTVGTHTFQMEIEEMVWFELYIRRESGTFTLTIDSVSIKEIIRHYGDLQPVLTPIVGDGLITNGSFDDWTADTPDEWTELDSDVTEVASGQDKTGAGTGAANLFGGGSATITQTLPIIGGRVYRVDLVVSYISGTDATVRAGFVTQENYTEYYATARAVGTYTFYLTHPGALDRYYDADFALSVVGTAPVEATIDSVEVTPVSFVTRYMDLTTVGYQIAPTGAVLQLASPYRGTLMKLTASYMELENVQLWVGKVTAVTPAPSIHDAERVITIVCLDPMDQMRDRDYLPHFQEDVTVDVALDKMFRTDPFVTFPYAASYWVLGVPGSSELGINTLLYDGPPMDFDTGIAVAPFVGDNSDRSQPSASDNRDVVKQGVSVMGYIRDLMALEVDGRFFWDGRTSQLIFHNRHHDLTTATPTATINNWTTAQFIASDRVYTEVEVVYQPREIGAVDSVVWTHADLPLKLAPKQAMTIQVRYSDPDNPGVRVGAKDVRQLAKNTDITGFENSDGTGSRRLRFLARHVDIRGNGATIQLQNNRSAGDIWITVLQLRGTPIKTYQQERVKATAPELQAVIDPIVYPYSAQLISDEDTAMQTADFLLSRYGKIRRRFASITYRAQVSDARMRNALQLTVGDVIRVESDNLQHQADYIIVGEQHRVNIARGEHDVTYILKPRDNLDFWLLGDEVHSILGVSTYLVF